MRPTITNVLDAVEAARTRGSVYLCAELLDLAGSMIPGIQDNNNATARLAFMAINDQVPIVTDVARHTYLEGTNR